MFIKIVDQINKVVQVLVVAMLAIATSVIVGSVIGRSVFFISIPWAEEVARYVIVWMVYWGAGVALRNGDLARLTILMSVLRLGDKGKRIFECITLTIMLAFYLLIGYAGIQASQLATKQLTSALKIPMWIPYSGVVLGAAILILNIIADFWLNAKGGKEVC